MIFSTVQWIIQRKLQLWLASKQRQFFKLFQQFFYYQFNGQRGRDKNKNNSGRGRRNSSYNCGGFIQKGNYSNQNSSNYKQLSPNSPNFSNPNPSIQILHAQSTKFSINQATQQSIVSKG